MLEIKTSSLPDRKTLKIDGQVFTVRRLGAGEQLRIGQITRQIETLTKDGEAAMTEEQKDKATELMLSMYDVMAGTFDDGGDGSKSKALVLAQSPEGLAELVKRAFDATEPTEQTV